MLLLIFFVRIIVNLILSWQIIVQLIIVTIEQAVAWRFLDVQKTKTGRHFQMLFYFVIILNRWRNSLGFRANHRYTCITPEQCNRRIKICNLHFTKDSFTCKFQNQLTPTAIP